MALNVFLVAGEASADLHGAALLRELKKLYPDLKCFGVGGEALKAEGMETLVSSHELNVVGISDWLDKLGEVIKAYKRVVKEIQRRVPDVAILLDLPDFNFRMASHLKRLRVPVCYYISPQVWAWRKYRLKKIKATVDQMLVLFPFEKKFYEEEGVSVQFVGHPLLEVIEPRGPLRTQEDILEQPRIALLPGSRKSEVRFHASLLRETAAKIREAYPKAQIRVPVASTLNKEDVQTLLGSSVECVEGRSREILAWADAACVASGTATLETALIGTPFCLLYRVSASSAWIFRKLVRYQGAIGLPNLLHGKSIVREFFQEEATPENLFLECQKILRDGSYREALSQALIECRLLLGNPGASERAARCVSQLVSSTTSFSPLQFRALPATS